MPQPTIGNFQIGSYADTQTPNGIPSRVDSTVSFVDGTRTFTITPTGSDYIVYVKGRRFIVDSVMNLQIPDVEGVHYIYFDDDEILHTTQVESKALMTDYAYVGAVHWNSILGYNIFVGDERHGVVMDPDTHYYIHSNPQGATLYVRGLGLTNLIVDGDGTADTHTQLGMDDGEILDEDLRHFVIDESPQDVSPTASIPVLYRSGANGEWRKKIADTIPVVYAGQEGSTGSLLSYNEWTGATWQWTELSNNNFMLIHIFVTNDIYTPVMALQGTNGYASLTDASVGAQNELKNFTGLPFEEGTQIATLILQTSVTFSNTASAIFVSDIDGNDFIDWRVSRTSVTGGGGISGTGNDLGEYTIATLPTAASFPNHYALATDASGGRTTVRSDGTNWKIIAIEGATVS